MSVSTEPDRRALAARQAMRETEDIFTRLILPERYRQLKKFGVQHCENGTGHDFFAKMADEQKAQNDARTDAGKPVTWRGILLEEVYEAMAETEPQELVAELTQVATVCVGWIADLEERKLP